jgi:hypothetical protein
VNLLRPNVFCLVAASRLPLQLPHSIISVTVPRGAVFRMDYILANFPRTVVANAQTSPELRIRLLDSRGVAVNEPVIPFHGFTTPAGGRNVAGVWAWRIEYPPGAVITLEISGQTAGPVPATVSITLLGQRGWGIR